MYIFIFIYLFMQNRVVHFEIPSDNPERTIDFFKQVFGWTFEKFGNEDYWLAMTGDPNAPGINGAVMKKKDPGQPLVNSIIVANLEAKVKQIEQAGGTVVVPKMTIPSVGWLAYFMDPDGNIHGIWEKNPAAQ